MSKKKKKNKLPHLPINDVNDREPKSASQATLDALYGRTSYGYTGKLD